MKACVRCWYQNLLTFHDLENSLVWHWPGTEGAGLQGCEMYHVLWICNVGTLPDAMICQSGKWQAANFTAQVSFPVASLEVFFLSLPEYLWDWPTLPHNTY